MSKKVNWAGVLLVIVCVAGIWYVSATFEQEISFNGTVVCVDEPSGTMWLEVDDGMWYMPVSPISAEYTNGTRVMATAVVKKGDIAMQRAKYVSVEIVAIVPA